MQSGSIGSGGPAHPAYPVEAPRRNVVRKGMRCQRYQSGKTAAGFFGGFWQRIKSFLLCGARPASGSVLPDNSPRQSSLEIRRCRDLFRSKLYDFRNMSDARAKELWEKFNKIYDNEYNAEFEIVRAKKGKLLKDAPMEAHAKASEKAANKVVIVFVAGEKTAGRRVALHSRAQLVSGLMDLKNITRPLFPKFPE